MILFDITIILPLNIQAIPAPNKTAERIPKGRDNKMTVADERMVKAHGQF